MATSKKWVQIDKPTGAYFLEGPNGNCGARVRPIRNLGWEWSTWRGRKSKGRVLHDQQMIFWRESDYATLRRAKRAAANKLAAACKTRRKQEL